MYLPKYLPPVKDTGIVGPAEGFPGERVKIRVGIPAETSSRAHSTSMPTPARCAGRGDPTGRDYSGRLTVAGTGDSQSDVTVHLSFDPRSVEGEVQEGYRDDGNPLEQFLAATLESIRRHIEEGPDKLPPPSPEG